jgi:hypothetical protein
VKPIQGTAPFSVTIDRKANLLLKKPLNNKNLGAEIGLDKKKGVF